ncbi:hypothetical protein [Cupriavidus necator]
MNQKIDGIRVDAVGIWPDDNAYSEDVLDSLTGEEAAALLERPDGWVPGQPYARFPCTLDELQHALGVYADAIDEVIAAEYEVVDPEPNVRPVAERSFATGRSAVPPQLDESLKPDRVVIADLASELAMATVDAHPDLWATGDNDELSRDIAINLLKQRCEWPTAPSVMGHIKLLLESGEITARSVAYDWPATNIEAPIEHPSEYWLSSEDADKVRVRLGFRASGYTTTAGTLAPQPSNTTAEGNQANLSQKPLQRRLHQEQEILQVISKLGYDPKKLPKQKPGAAGVKSAVRQKLPYSKKVFDKAWERLRSASDIADA